MDTNSQPSFLQFSILYSGATKIYIKPTAALESNYLQGHCVLSRYLQSTYVYKNAYSSCTFLLLRLSGIEKNHVFMIFFLFYVLCSSELRLIRYIILFWTLDVRIVWSFGTFLKKVSKDNDQNIYHHIFTKQHAYVVQLFLTVSNWTILTSYKTLQ